MNSRILARMLLSLSVAFCLGAEGCKKKSSSPPPSRPQTSPVIGSHKPSPPQKATPIQARDPLAIVVEVDGHRLTRGEMDERMREILRSQGLDKAPPTVIQKMRPRLETDIRENFIVETLLLQEAERMKQEITQKDVDVALEEIADTLPSGKTLKEFLEERGMTRESLAEDPGFVRRLKIIQILKKVTENVEEPSEEEMRSYYEENEAEMMIPSTFHVRHIAVKVGQGASEEEKAKKRAKIEEARLLLLNERPFSEVALSHSECPSRENGGELGPVAKSRWGEIFDAACRTQELEKIGEIIETPHGFHVVQVLERNEGRQQTFEEVKDRIREILVNRKESPLVQAFIQGLKDKAEIVGADSDS